MKNVATYCRWKFILGAILFRIPFGLFFIGVTPFALVMSVDEVQHRFASPVLYAMCIVPFLIGYAFFSSGVRRIQAACLKGCWLKAGPDGIAFRLPYKAKARTLFLTYHIAEHTFAWADIRRYYPLHYKVNGIPFGQSLVLETTRGRFVFVGAYFRESADHIVLFIQAAAKGS